MAIGRFEPKNVVAYLTHGANPLFSRLLPRGTEAPAGSFTRLHHVLSYAEGCEGRLRIRLSSPRPQRSSASSLSPAALSRERGAWPSMLGSACTA